MHYKITIFGACAPYPRLIYWIVSSISQGKKDDIVIKIRTLVIRDFYITSFMVSHFPYFSYSMRHMFWYSPLWLPELSCPARTGGLLRQVEPVIQEFYWLYASIGWLVCCLLAGPDFWKRMSWLLRQWSIENDAHGIEKLLLKTQVIWISSCIVKQIY